MRAYNPMTVIRQTSRSVLKEFFTEHRCLECLNFEKDKLYEIQDAFRTLPEGLLRKVEIVMRNVFNLAGNEAAILRLLDEAKTQNGEFNSEIQQFKNRYDMAFHIYLHHRTLWEKACTFLQVDNLPGRHWCRCPNLPKQTPRTDRSACEDLGRQISAFFWHKQVRGKKYLIEYQKRTGDLHYYFVYLSDYANSYEAWSEQNSELERKNETRAINMVFAYDMHFGTLDTYNLGGTKIAMVLQKIFCDTILGYHLVDKQILKSAFDIERLKYRKNIPIALPHVGITRAWISCLEFNYQGAGKRRTHRMSLDDVVRDDEIYSVMEHDLNRENVPLNVIVIKFVRIILEIEWNNCKRRMTIELTRNSCTLKSNADELRKIGEYFIQENGIDVQPNLF